MVKAGFIGLGSQGGPMAARIAEAGFPLTVWARRPDALEPFVAQGASAAASVEQLGAACDHVGLCVVDDAGVAAICGRLIPAMAPGSILVIHSTILPESCEALAERCAANGIAFLDAPVSGGGQGAAAGTLTVMCGGTTAALEQARPVLASFAGAIVHLGEAGAAQRAKIVNNALMAANLGLADAALAAGAALGIDRAALSDLIGRSSGRSYGGEVRARLPSAAAFAGGARLLTKDVGLLKSILPEEPAAEMLRAAAAPFLAAATA